MDLCGVRQWPLRNLGDRQAKRCGMDSGPDRRYKDKRSGSFRLAGAEEDLRWTVSQSYDHSETMVQPNSREMDGNPVGFQVWWVLLIFALPPFMHTCTLFSLYSTKPNTYMITISPWTLYTQVQDCDELPLYPRRAYWGSVLLPEWHHLPVAGVPNIS